MKKHINGKELSPVEKVEKLKKLKQELEKNTKLTALTFECFFKLEYYKDTGGRPGDVTIEYKIDENLDAEFKAITTTLKHSTHITTLDLTGEHLSDGMVKCLKELIKERPDLTLVLNIEKIPTSTWRINGYPCYAPVRLTLEELVLLSKHPKITPPKEVVDVVVDAEEVVDVVVDAEEVEGVVEDEKDHSKKLEDLQNKFDQLKEQLENRKGWMSQIAALFCCCIPSFSRNRIRGKNTQNDVKASYVASGKQVSYLGALGGSGADTKRAYPLVGLRRSCASKTKPKNLTY